MVCPQCGERLKLIPRAIHNVEAYGRPLLAVTECCKKMVHVSRQIIINVVPSDETEDSWGVHVGETVPEV